MIMIMIDIQKLCVKPLNTSVNNPPNRPYNAQGFTDLKVKLRHCMSCQLSIKKRQIRLQLSGFLMSILLFSADTLGYYYHWFSLADLACHMYCCGMTMVEA